MKREFAYGPIAQGIFIALLCLTPLLSYVSPGHLGAYLLFLLFLGLGLRPLLVKTGLHKLWRTAKAGTQRGMDHKFVERRRAAIDVQAKLGKFRHSRYREPRMPRHW
jgi:hypothetical protein